MAHYVTVVNDFWSRLQGHSPPDSDTAEALDSSRIALSFLPCLLSRAGKSDDLFGFLHSKGFKSIFLAKMESQCELDDVYNSIAQYKRVSAIQHIMSGPHHLL